MLPTPFENALVLTGPTGSGKTRLGIELAGRLNAEIMSMDSMALYRGMDIGTAKPTIAERAGIPHHLIDVREPWEGATVAWWLEEARRVAREIESRGRRVLFVGGTPLYLKALVFGLFDGPAADADLRRRLTEEARLGGPESLWRRLQAVDPISATRIHVNDVRRMVRALEVYELTGKPMSAWQTQWEASSTQYRVPSTQMCGSSTQHAVPSTQTCGFQQPSGHSPKASSTQYPVPSTQAAQAPDHGAETQYHHQHSVLGTRYSVLWLDLPRPELYERINRRVEEMFAAGLVDEVRRLRGLHRPLSREAGQALGYKEIHDLLDGTITLKEAIVRVQTRSRHFARRQITWFRHLPFCQPATMELTQTLWEQTINNVDRKSSACAAHQHAVVGT